MSFGEMLRKLRHQRGISQRDLGDRIGIDFTYISKIENSDLPPPSEETLLKMADVFAVDKYDFVISADKIPTDFETIIKRNKDIQDLLKERVKELMKEERK